MIDDGWGFIMCYRLFIVLRERERIFGWILVLYIIYFIIIGFNIRYVIDIKKVWFFWNLLRDVYYIYLFNIKYEKCDVRY